MAAGKTFEGNLYRRAVTHREKVVNVTELLTYDDMIYKMASTDPQDYPVIYQLEDSNALAISFNQLKQLSGVENIRLYVKMTICIPIGNTRILPLDSAADTNWYKTVARRLPIDGTRLWILRINPPGSSLFFLYEGDI